MALPALKPHFVKKYGDATRPGLPIQEFVKILFKQLLSDHPDLGIMKEASHVIALLHELFRQIGEYLLGVPCPILLPLLTQPFSMNIQTSMVMA